MTLIAVALVAFASAFGVARAADSGETSGTPATAEPRAVALRTASALPAMNAPPGPTEAELAAQREAEAEAKRQAAAERKKKAEERKRQQEQDAAPEPEQTTPEPPPPTSTTPVGEPFDDSG